MSVFYVFSCLIAVIAKKQPTCIITRTGRYRIK
jgi:hypothetical protein